MPVDTDPLYQPPRCTQNEISVYIQRCGLSGEEELKTSGATTFQAALVGLAILAALHIV